MNAKLIKDVIKQHLFEDPEEFKKNVKSELSIEDNIEISDFRYPSYTFTLKIKDTLTIDEHSYDSIYKVFIENVNIKVV
jgi:hypothetical protein